MKTKLLTLFFIAALTLGCKKEKQSGCLYEAPKTNYVNRIGLIDYVTYGKFKEMQATGDYGKLIWVEKTDCNCPNDYVDAIK